MIQEVIAPCANIRARLFKVNDQSTPIDIQFWKDYAKNERVTSMVVANRDFDEKKGGRKRLVIMLYFQNPRSTKRTNAMLNPDDDSNIVRLALPY
ncbi:MAG TPA: hypothetical protein VGF75_03365, partial [Candidatus Saccharimonadales bacterium]